MISKEFKKILRSFFVAVLVASMVLPGISLAKAGDNKPEQAPQGQQQGQKGNADAPKLGDGNGNFCSQLGKLEQNQLRLTERQSKMEENRQKRDTNLANRYQERQSKRFENREKWDANRSEHFDALMELADTDAKKQAVTQFQSAVSSAISTRQSAFDTAIEVFRVSADNLWQSKKADADNLVNAFRNQVQAIIANIKEECGLENANDTALRNTFREQVQSAKKSLQSGKSSVEEMKSSIQNLNEAKKQAMKKALAEFKVTMEQARTDLKTALSVVE